MQVVRSVKLLTETLIPCDTISKLPVLQTLEEVEILNCYPCFLLPLTQFQKDISVIRGSASDQKGEEKEGKKRELHTQLTFCYAVQLVDANSKRTVGMLKGERKRLHGVSRVNPCLSFTTAIVGRIWPNSLHSQFVSRCAKARDFCCTTPVTQS